MTNVYLTPPSHPTDRNSGARRGPRSRTPRENGPPIIMKFHIETPNKDGPPSQKRDGPNCAIFLKSLSSGCPLLVSAATRDKGVAICVAETIAVAVLDGESIRGQECSVAQSLKMVRPSLPIILLEERGRLSNIPEGIDAVVPLGDAEQLLRKIEELLNPGRTESRAAG